MGATMAQFRIPFPGENEHVERLLKTAESLMRAGSLDAAYQTLVLAEREERVDEETAWLHDLYGRLADLADRKALAHRFAAQPDPRFARVLLFGAVRACPSRASSARRSAL